MNDNTIRGMSFACWINKTKDTLRICNISCFSAAKIDTRTRISITCIRVPNLPVLLSTRLVLDNHCHKDLHQRISNSGSLPKLG